MTSDHIRKKILVRGIVQGVGFRPFIYNLARNEGLTGWVSNSSRGVEIEAEGSAAALESFSRRIISDKPPLSQITDVTSEDIPCDHSTSFEIHKSRGDVSRRTLISPDISICADCEAELLDTADRRFNYPFINCTNCGPRYTIIKDIPYDRPATTMAEFQMCPSCGAEYTDPANRRFHAQPNACVICGPEVSIYSSDGKKQDVKDPIRHAGDLLKSGKIIAVKGLGGFHLACDARNNEVVKELRHRKGREAKPLAVMSADRREADSFALITPAEDDLLHDMRRPIVLLSKKPGFDLGVDVAPGNRYIGVMLPYTPLHVMLFQYGPGTLVMTSGNLSEEPIAVKNDDAFNRLHKIADYFLSHDREIYQRADDSVFQVVDDIPRPIRRSRGYVPSPVFFNEDGISVLAVGAELKNTFCLTRDNEAFPGPHIGDLENLETQLYFEESINHLRRILTISPDVIAHDLHPDYMSTKWAHIQNLPMAAVQHHHAHIASCLAENGFCGRVIGLAMDGTGYGDDGAVWGGEVLIADTESYIRAAHFDYRPMPGATVSIQEPWRMAVSYLWAAYSSDHPDSPDQDFIQSIASLPLVERAGLPAIATVLGMIKTGFNVINTSSLGRLFDAVSAVIGIKSKVEFEGQAAMMLEMVLENCEELLPGYSFDLIEKDDMLCISPDPIIRSVKDDFLEGVPHGRISLKFHSALVTCFTEICCRAREKYGLNTAALSGGCFQNRFLLSHVTRSLTGKGFDVLTHRQVPANDGGISLGQAAVAIRKCKEYLS